MQKPRIHAWAISMTFIVEQKGKNRKPKIIETAQFIMCSENLIFIDHNLMTSKYLFHIIKMNIQRGSTVIMSKWIPAR